MEDIEYTDLKKILYKKQKTIKIIELNNAGFSESVDKLQAILIFYKQKYKLKVTMGMEVDSEEGIVFGKECVLTIWLLKEETNEEYCDRIKSYTKRLLKELVRVLHMN